MHYVYAIYNIELSKVYIGETDDLAKRIEWHNAKKFNKSYTAKIGGKWQLIYFEEVPDRVRARLRERQLKSYQGRLFLKRYIPR